MPILPWPVVFGMLQVGAGSRVVAVCAGRRWGEWYDDDDERGFTRLAGYAEMARRRGDQRMCQARPDEPAETRQ